jgi:hypothetical protein
MDLEHCLHWLHLEPTHRYPFLDECPQLVVHFSGPFFQRARHLWCATGEYRYEVRGTVAVMAMMAMMAVMAMRVVRAMMAVMVGGCKGRKTQGASWEGTKGR